jgi:hypothetical protein
MSIRVVPQYYSPIGFQKLTVSNLAVGFTLPASPVTRAAILTVETDAIRFRLDGSDPDASSGHIVAKDDSLELTNVQMVQNFKAIRVTNDATLNITYFGGCA